ncbi:MFS transporter [Alicyclobacillus sp. SO9]|uniref:MFS transporter n=1 Tax=Alicyclobacillus sp. SO9 TaxID=2665646 RepID=UPI0018E8A3D6|nr:MFS transporter [Alicyclobacillus sp. SO9]QQE77213.1 MFS transporter [Alicyclobacillus sp. SO9]
MEQRMEQRIQSLRIATGWLTLFMVGTDLFVVSPLLPSISKQFSVTPGEAGWMVAAFSTMYAVSAPWLGTLSDWFGKRKTIVIGLLGFSVANVLTSLAPSFALLIMSRVLAGLCAAAVTPSIYAITGDVAPAERRGGWLAIVGSGLLMALWTGAPIGTLVSQVTGWKVIFAGLAVISLALVLFNQRIWPASKRKPRQPSLSKSTTGGTLRNVLGDVIIMSFWGTAVYGLYTYLGTGLRLFSHFSPGLIAVALIVYGVGATIGSLSGGRLSDRWGAGRVSTISLVGLGLLLGLAALLFHSRVWLFPLLLLWAFAGYAFFPAFQSWLAQRFSERRGMAMAWNNSALYAGITLGSLLGGWVITKWTFSVLPLICAVIALTGGLLIFVRRKDTVTTELPSSHE